MTMFRKLGTGTHGGDFGGLLLLQKQLWLPLEGAAGTVLSSPAAILLPEASRWALSPLWDTTAPGASPAVGT